MNQSTNWGANSDDDEDPDLREGWMWGGKRAFIFLIDATGSMFDKNIDDISYFMQCVEACKELMLQKIFNQEDDLFGIVLYGVKRVGQTAVPNHVITLQDLAMCSADKIKDLINILEDVDSFEDEHGHSNDFSLAEALWHCQKMVSNCTTKIYQKVVYLMTCNDNPHSGSNKMQHDTRTRANDLSQVGMQLKIIPFGINFNTELFFKELQQISCGEDDTSSCDITVVQSVEDILALFESSVSKRSTSRVVWSLGEDVKIGVAAYRFVKATTSLPKKVKMERSKNAIVAPRVQTYNVDTGEEVGRAEISKAVVIGGETVTFEAEELKKGRELSKPGLILLGFKPAHTLELWYHRKAPYFLYPEERLVKGSRTLFAALHERCIARRKIAICYFTPRQSARPALVALTPISETIKKNIRLVPSGFQLRYLPYADNIRNLTEQAVKCPHPEPELVTVAEKIVDKMKFIYNPSLIDNPKLQKHWAGIEALALSYMNPREIIDSTVPDYETIDSRLDELAFNFMNMAFPDGFDENMIKAPAPKKARLDIDNMTMEDLAKQGLVEKLTVDKLKIYLSGEGVKITKMKKAELVAAVYVHLGICQPL